MPYRVFWYLRTANGKIVTKMHEVRNIGRAEYRYHFGGQLMFWIPKTEAKKETGKNRVAITMRNELSSV
jgi:hypothetical protein